MSTSVAVQENYDSEFGTLMTRLSEEMQRAVDLAVDLEHEICVYAEKAAVDRKENFQSADLLVQFLTNIHTVMRAVEGDEKANHPIAVSQYTSDVTLRDMQDRLEGRAVEEVEFEGGDLDLF